MRIDLTHLAVKKPLSGDTGIKGFLRGVFAPVDVMSEGFLRKMGTLKEVEYNYKGGVFAGVATGPTATGAGVISVNEINLDFAAIAAARVAAGQAAIGAADILNLFGVKAGTWVPACFAQTTTVEGGTATFDIGDGATAAGYISNGDFNVVGWASSLITTTFSLATAGGKLYTADDTIDMIVDTASVAVSVVRVIAVTVDLRATR